MLHKIKSTMHDTCHGANLAAKLIADKKEESAREFYGDEVWEAMSDEDRATSDFRRGNHSRNLPVAAFNRLFTACMNEELGEQFEAAVAAGGGRARLEKDGPSLLRSIAKLAHDGHGAYAKGDGTEVTAFMALRDLPPMKLERADLASRQDWVLETSEELFPHIQPLTTCDPPP